MILAHWTYTREEWKEFHHWKLRKKSLFQYLWNRLRPRKQKYTPAIKITAESVWTNERREIFHMGGKTIHRISIMDTGKMNVLEISYQDEKGIHEIIVPIPKGKLRDAIRLQEDLLYRYPFQVQTKL